MTFMGFVTNWSGLMAARWFLGLAEAGLFPGVNYYLSCWYKRSEFGVRAAIFFSAAAVSGSFGGLLAAAIENMHGLGGRPGWAWIFILEGILTVLFGFASFWVVHDFPDLATFLSEQDRARVIRRLKEDQQSSAEHEEFKMKYVWLALKDYKMWIGMVIYMGCDMPLYAFSLFLPTIISELGYKTTKAQLLTVPPYAAAAVLVCFSLRARPFSHEITFQRIILTLPRQ
jgi:MFS family permease